MVSAGDLRKGTKILYKNEPYVIVDFQHVKPGKGGAYMRTKMRNLITGLVHEHTFRSEEKLPIPDLQYHQLQYLYSHGGDYEFMDQENFDQISLNKKQLEDVLSYLKEQEIYTALYFNDRPIEITPPLFMELKVAETVPGVRGDTAQGGGNKPATLETGLVLQVPLFVTEEDVLKVDTRDGSYIERVKK